MLPACGTENAGYKLNSCRAGHPARAAQCRFEHWGCHLQRDGERKPYISFLYPMGTRKARAPVWALMLTGQHVCQSGEFHQGIIHPQHPPSPRGFTLPDCIPHLTPYHSWWSCRSHNATPMAAARAPWPERAAGESCHAGSVPCSSTASSVAGQPALPAPHCEFPSIFSPVINNSSGIRHQLPKQRGRGATRHPKQTEPPCQQRCPSEPSSRTFRYTLGPCGDRWGLLMSALAPHLLLFLNSALAQAQEPLPV